MQKPDQQRLTLIKIWNPESLKFLELPKAKEQAKVETWGGVSLKL